MLHVPPWRWNYCSTSDDGNPQGSTHGVNFTAGANNADGTAVTVLSALAHDVHLLYIGLAGINQSNNEANAMGTLLFDPAGGTSWADTGCYMPCGYTGTISGASGMPMGYAFPIYIPAGTSVGFRCRTNYTADITSGRVAAEAYGEPSRPDAVWYGHKFETLGASMAASEGTAHTPGVSNAFSTWASIGTTTGRWGAIQLGLNGTDGTAAAAGVKWQLGVSSSQLAGTPNMHQCMTTNETSGRFMSIRPIPCDIPPGSSVQVRGMNDSNPAETFNVVVIGVY